MGPHGSRNVKTLLLPQLWFFFNQPFSKYSLLHSSQKLLVGILNWLKVSLTLDLWEWKFQSTNPTTIMILCKPYLFWMSHVTVLTKVTWWDFAISNLLKTDWNFTLCPMGKWKIVKILEMASRRVKQSEIWGSWVVVTGIWGTFDLYCLRSFWGY